MMSRFNNVPVIIQQMVEDIRSPSTPTHVKFNKVVVLQAVKDYCDLAIKDHEKEVLKQQAKRR
jgi:hypothetical protein